MQLSGVDRLGNKIQRRRAVVTSRDNSIPVIFSHLDYQWLIKISTVASRHNFVFVFSCVSTADE